MESDVIKSGFKLLPNIGFWNEEGVCAFGAQDLDPVWRMRPRPAGRYKSKVRIPGNFHADGKMFVNANLSTLAPNINQFHESNAIAYQVVDNFDGDMARGDYTGRMKGIVRPILQWSTKFSPD